MAMMFATNSNLETEVAGTAKTYDNALSEAWSFLDNVKKVGCDLCYQEKTEIIKHYSILIYYGEIVYLLLDCSLSCVY